MEFEYEQFITTIQHKAEASWEEADRSCRRLPSRRLPSGMSAGEARDIVGAASLATWAAG